MTSGSFEIFLFLSVIQNKNEGIKGTCNFSSKEMWLALSRVPLEQG